jgi:hypothetical protein
MLISSDACLSPPQYSTSSHKRHDFRKKVTACKMYISVFFLTSISNISYSKKNPARYRHKCRNVFAWSTCHSCRILIKLRFFNRCSRKAQIPNFVKLHPVGAELFHADEGTDGRTDRQTDMTKLIVAFRNFANASKMINFTRKMMMMMMMMMIQLPDSLCCVQNHLLNNWLLWYGPKNSNNWFPSHLNYNCSRIFDSKG